MLLKVRRKCILRNATYLGVLWAAALASMSAAPVGLLPEAEATNAAVTQGAVIHRVGSSEWCKVGYVDRASATLITAGHCGEDGSRWELRGPNGKIELGSLQSAHSPGDITDDVGVIAVSRSALLGGNLPQARQIAGSVHVGERVCVSTQRNTSGAPASCDTITAIVGDVVFAGPGLLIARGDSGAPAWTDSGLIGVISGPRLDPVSGRVVAVRIARVTPEHLKSRASEEPQQQFGLSSSSSLSSLK